MDPVNLVDLDYSAYAKARHWRVAACGFAVASVPWLILLLVNRPSWRDWVVLFVFAFFSGLTIASARRAAHWSDAIARIERAYDDGSRARWPQVWGAMHQPVVVRWHQLGDRASWGVSGSVG